MLGHDSGIASKVAGLQKQAKVPGNWYFNNEKKGFENNYPIKDFPLMDNCL